MESNLLTFIPFDKEKHEESPQFNNINEIEGVESIKQINCFIGSNNSGKSRLIRKLFNSLINKERENILYFKFFDAAYKGDRWNTIFVIHYLKKDKILNPFHEAVTYLLDQANYHSEGQNHILYYHTNKLQEYKEIITLDNLYHLFAPYRNNLFKLGNTDQRRLRKINSENWNNIDYILSPNSSAYQSHANAFLNRLHHQINDLSDSVYSFLFQNFNIPKLYIPTLRGMRTLTNSVDYYAQRTEKDYFIEQDNIFTGLSIYKELQNYLFGELNERKAIKCFQDFLSKSFFDCQEVELVPIKKSDVVYIKIGDKEHPIYDLGDGVQALILLTFPLFLRKDKECAIFIEEPETHLHPKWQRFFLETIIEYFPKHQFFFTTHSNVLMNWHSSNIYYVKQDPNSDKTLVQHVDTQHSEILEELGYQASDLLNANYIVWVEGISDKVYLKQFIKAFDDSLVEGIHYTIMMYGGCAQLRHFAIEEEESYKIRIDNMSKHFGFCVDSDASQPKGFSLDKEKKKFKEACEEAEKFCWVTTVREIENLIPLDIWKEAAVSYTKTIKHHSDKTIATNAIDYSENDLYGDRMKTKVKVEKSNPVSVNDKIKMAQQVVKIFPKNEADLKMTPELFNNIDKLVSEIKSRNLL